LRKIVSIARHRERSETNRYEHASDWLGTIRFVSELFRQFVLPPLFAIRLDVRKALTACNYFHLFDGSVPMLMSIRGMAFAMAKGIGAFALGGVILWQVVTHIGPQHGIAYVHVSATNVDVMVDDAKYHIESIWDSPLVCELSPGPHLLRMHRCGQVIYKENFSLDVAQEVVLTAWEPPCELPVQVAGTAPASQTALTGEFAKQQLPWRTGRRFP
jgi:hypothetical protein